jgi:hypothetical protein
MYVLAGKNNTVEKYPFTVQDLRRRHKNVSFPAPIPEETLNSFGVYSVLPTPTPSYDKFKSKVRVIAVYSHGGWKQSHSVVDLPEEQVKAKVASRAREELADTDKDVMLYLEQNLSVPDDLITFRSYMREIESQEGYPYSLSWPTKPNK